MKISMAVALAASVLVAGAAQAQTATFNFESQPNTGFTGASTSAVITRSGVTMTLTRPGSTFDFNGGASPLATGFGGRSLSPFSDETGATPFVADFSTGLLSFGIQYGDYGADADVFTLSLYSGLGGTGTLVGTLTADYGLRAFIDADGGIGSSLLTVTSPFRSAVFSGGSASFPNSLYYDNISVTGLAAGVPEPASWALMILGFGAVGGAMRRRSTSRSIVGLA